MAHRLTEKEAAQLDARFALFQPQANRVPYNQLHDQGFPSIGCAPCTRAIEPGEDPRAGRWWWELDPEHKECGIHIAIPGPVRERSTP